MSSSRGPKTPEQNVHWVRPRSITAENCPACQLSDRVRWVMSGRPTLLDRGLWLIVEKSVDLSIAEGSTLDPFESVFEFMRLWPAATAEYVFRFAEQLTIRDLRVLAYGRAAAEIEREKKGARPHGRAPGTRKARRKRRSRPGRR